MKTKNLFLISWFILVLALLGYVAFQVYNTPKEAYSCLTNPLVYGVNDLSEKNNVDISCNCKLLVPNSPSIIVTRTNLSLLLVNDNPLQNFTLKLGD